MALSAERGTPYKAPGDLPYKVAGNTKILKGGLVVLDAGYLKPGTVATGLVTVGMATETVDNLGGAAGAKTCHVKRAVILMRNHATDTIVQADVGSNCYVVDDETVAKTSATNTRSVAGRVIEIDGAMVWVEAG